VLARTPAPSLAIDRTPLLGAGFPPLGIVHVATNGSEIDVPWPLEVPVGGDGAQQVSLDALSLSGPLEHVAPFLRCRGLELRRVDARCQETAALPTGGGSFPVGGWAAREFGAASRDPAVVVLGRPPAAVLGFVVIGMSDQLLGAAHLGGVELLLELPAP
jgi:hypothetical protein